MSTLKEKQSISSLYGKMMNALEAAQLTEGFTTMRNGRAYVSFDAQAMANLIAKHKCKLISFRYYAAGENIGLIFGPIYPAGFNKPEWIDSEDQRIISREAVQLLTQDDEYDVQGIKSHIYSAALVQKVLSLCTTETRVYFGTKENRPALVIAPADVSSYNQEEAVFLDYGSYCPPDCHQIFE